ncbi:unnamed protein product [Rhizophagus irregularis]|nr:unnamed protein product [Rhizophagus irregularis]
MNGNQDFVSGGLPKIGKQRTKVVFRRTENGELRSWVSWVSSEKWKKPKFVSDLGWVSEEQKKKMNLNGLVRRIVVESGGGVEWCTVIFGGV